MGRLFDFEGPVFSTLSRLADLFWLNLLYIICCIPIVTIGAATTALYYVTLKMARDEEGYITKSYFKSFKDNFRQATIIWLIFLFFIIVLITDLIIANGGSFDSIFNISQLSSVVLIAAGIAGIVILFTLSYVFALLAQFDNTVFNTIKNAFLISVRHLPYTIAIIVISVIPLVIMYLSPAGLIIVVIAFSLVCYINSKFFNKIFKLYMPKEEPEQDDTEGESVVTDSAV